jgi:hypothetical protein
MNDFFQFWMIKLGCVPVDHQYGFNFTVAEAFAQHALSDHSG